VKLAFHYHKTVAASTQSVQSPTA